MLSLKSAESDDVVEMKSYQTQRRASVMRLGMWKEIMRTSSSDPKAIRPALTWSTMELIVSFKSPAFSPL